MSFLSLVLSLPTNNATTRQRVWRSLKASGAAVLRDGVYLMPAFERCQSALDLLADDVREAGGSAWVLRVEAEDNSDFMSLFDRSGDFEQVLGGISDAHQRLNISGVQDVLKQTRKLRKAFNNLREIDFFPTETQNRVETGLLELETACARVSSPDEPTPVDTGISLLERADFRGRQWATRKRPWVDRLASAWLIQRFIDPEAHFIWLESPAACSGDVLGFDFDGAMFSHVGGLVTFEVMLRSFALSDPALMRIGYLVHYLDVGGTQPPEAVGVESVLAGLRATLSDDDQLLACAIRIFDGLFAEFSEAEQSNERGS